ncbi:MAG: APC family permease [Thermoflexales bacterium]|nr:APC family permease [Thermoflexales bacterium]MDW8351902.1 APC family permease [Anaerolineae bacterium]
MSIKPTDEHTPKLALGALGFPDALAAAIGLIIASSVLLTATQGYGAGGWVFAIAILIAYVIMLCQSSSFAEAAGILPTSGAVYDYVAAGLGRLLAIMATLAAYLVVHVFAGTAEVASIGLFARVNFDLTLPTESTWIIGTLVVLVFMVINMLGVNVFGRIETLMTGVMWVTLFSFGLIGVLRAPQSGVTGFFGESNVGTDLNSVLAMVGLAMFLFVGVEYVTPLAPELKNPNRTIPLAMYLGVTMVAAAMFVYGAGIARQVPNTEVEPGVFTFDTPLAIPAFGLAILGPIGKLWLGIAAFLAGCSTVNTLLAGIPRILYGMAKDGTMPSIFGYLHPRFKTPWVGIILAALIPIIGAISIQGNINSVIAFVLAGVCAWIFGYVLVNISVIVLRARRPDLNRPYKAPLYPLLQIIATLGMLITIGFITPPFLTSEQIYVPFVIMLAVCAVFAFVWLVLVRRERPFDRVEPETILKEEGLS